MVVLGGGAVSYERGTPVVSREHAKTPPMLLLSFKRGCLLVAALLQQKECATLKRRKGDSTHRRSKLLAFKLSREATKLLEVKHVVCRGRGGREIFSGVIRRRCVLSTFLPGPWQSLGLCYQLGGDTISVLADFISLPDNNH